MARTPASDGRDGVGKSGSPAPRSITSSPAALRRFASCEMAIVAEVSRWCRLGERPDPGVMGGRIARTGKGTQPEPSLRCLSLHHAAGVGRTGRVLKERSVDMLAGAPKALAALLERAALKLDAVTSVVLAWPEALAEGDGAAVLDTVLGETRDARRIVLSWNPALLRDFLERHARRALVVGMPPVDETGRPLPPVCRARFAVVPSFRRSIALRDALDVLDATTPFVWNGGPITPPEARPDAVLCTALPSRDELTALARLGGGEPVVFIAAIQLPYLRSIATLTPLAVASGTDRARDRAEALRERVAALLTTGSVDAALALLDPLFERFDPGEGSAALLALQREAGSEIQDATVAGPVDAARVRVFVGVGKKDRASAKDLVGALIREAGVPKGDIGRIDVRETFSLVEVTAGAADRAVRGLTGTTIRGRRVLARLDRER